MICSPDCELFPTDPMPLAAIRHGPFARPLPCPSRPPHPLELRSPVISASIPSWPVLLVVACLGVPALIAALLAIRGSGDASRRRCPACTYDLSGTQGRTCPECGHAAPSEASLFGRRRHPFRAAALLTLAILAVTAGLYWDARVRIYYALMPTWKLVATTTIAGHEVRHYTKTDPEDFGERIVISREGQPPIAIEDYKLTLGSAMANAPTRLGMGEDITGDGTPDLAIVGFSGGAHCCETLHVIELGPTLRTIAQIDLANGGALIPTQTPGVAELFTADWTFTYWNTSYVASPKPRVALRWRDGKFRLYETGAQRTPRLDEAALQALALDYRTTPVTGLDARVWSTALDLIYAGHYDRGIAFIREAWNPDSGDVEKFLAEFTKTLESSPYWPEIKAITARP
jgi:hypothetical protein